MVTNQLIIIPPLPFPTTTTTTTTMYPKSWFILCTIVSIANVISCENELEKVEETISMYQDYDNLGYDTSVFFIISAPSKVENDIPLIRFDVTYQLVTGANSQSEPKTVSHGLVHDGKFYMVKIENLEPNSRYIFNGKAIYGSNGVAQYFAPTRVKNYPANTLPLAPKTFLSQEKLLTFEADNVRTFTIQVDQFFGDELQFVMTVDMSPEMGNNLLLNLKDGERYLIKVWYEDVEGKTSATSEHIYPMETN